MTLTQEEKGISGKMRIAAFLQSVDPGYFEVWSRFGCFFFVWIIEKKDEKRRIPLKTFMDLGGGLTS